MFVILCTSVPIRVFHLGFSGNFLPTESSHSEVDHTPDPSWKGNQHLYLETCAQNYQLRGSVNC